MLSLPILDETAHTRFRDVASPKGEVGSLVRQLTSGKVTGDSRIHLDPDLNPESRPRLPGWLPAFGQTRSSQRHLENQGVGQGALFLFWGWFKHIENSPDGSWQYRASSPNQHVIFGWLQVEESIALRNESDYTRVLKQHPWLQEHPHVKETCWPQNNKEGRYTWNTIYIASKTLDLPGLTHYLPGGGVFPCFSEKLALTAPAQYNAKQRRSVWALPRCFLPKDGRPRLTYHTKLRRWTPRGERVILESVARGQEFVLDSDQHPGLIEWVGSLFENIDLEDSSSA